MDRPLLRFAFLATAIGFALPALAAYPERPVTIVVPFAPGGANDVVVRAIQQPLAEALGQPIVVENRGGAGGSLGTGHAARQKPDGYTILMAATGFAVNPSLYRKISYDPLKDFEPVAEVTTFPVIYAVRPDLGVKTMKELIAYAKKRAGGLNYSTPGAGTLPHLAAELLKLNTGVEMVHVPYPGAAPAAQALLNKTVDVASISISVVPRTGSRQRRQSPSQSNDTWPWIDTPRSIDSTVISPRTGVRSVWVSSTCCRANVASIVTTRRWPSRLRRSVTFTIR